MNAKSPTIFLDDLNTHPQHMKTDTHEDARQFAIAQLKAVMDAEKEKRAASRKLHAEKELAAAQLEGGRDWSVA
jgi:hypothetical protein